MTQLLLCGPQSHLPSDPDPLKPLHALLLRRTSLCTALSSAARDLPALLRLLCAFDSSLHNVPTASIDFLRQWLESGSVSQPVDELLSVVALPFAVLLQSALFLQHLDDDNASQNTQSLPQYAVQGFCTGFLTAAAIAFSQNEDQLAENIVISVRLAACLGAYIDQNALYAEPANPACSLSVRWREFSKPQVEDLLARYPHVREPPDSQDPSSFRSCVVDC